MSLDATVWDVTREGCVVKIWLKDREPRGCAGQASLTVIGPCRRAELLVGHDVWAAGDGPIMCGDVVVGERIGAAHCVLFNRPIRDIVGTAEMAAQDERDRRAAEAAKGGD